MSESGLDGSRFFEVKRMEKHLLKVSILRGLQELYGIMDVFLVCLIAPEPYRID